MVYSKVIFILNLLHYVCRAFLLPKMSLNDIYNRFSLLCQHLQDHYNNSKYISLNYSTGPKVIHEGVRSYLKNMCPEKPRMFLCLQNLTLTVEHAGLLGHSSRGVRIGLLSSKMRYQALTVIQFGIRTGKPIVNRSVPKGAESKREPSRSDAMLHSDRMQLALQSTVSFSHCL